jgi:predicted nucleic acid-binding protein
VGRRVPTPLIPRLVLDTGALIALERGDPRARAQLAAATRRGYAVVVPVLVLMEALEHARPPERLNQVLAALDAELALAPAVARQVAGLKRRAGVTSDADAIVVLEALAVPGSAILTGDPDDIHALLDASGSAGHVPVLRV